MFCFTFCPENSILKIVKDPRTPTSSKLVAEIFSRPFCLFEYDYKSSILKTPTLFLVRIVYDQNARSPRKLSASFRPSLTAIKLPSVSMKPLKRSVCTALLQIMISRILFSQSKNGKRFIWLSKHYRISGQRSGC